MATSCERRRFRGGEGSLILFPAGHMGGLKLGKTIGAKFFSPGQADDPLCVRIRDNGPASRQERIEQMWAKYQQYADPDFLKQAQKDLPPRLWEMHLGCSLMDRGHHLAKKRSAEGPDVCVLASDGRVWFEAVLPGPGDGPDRVLPCGDEEIREVLEDKIVLRLRNAIENREDGIVAEGEPCVVNGLDRRDPRHLFEGESSMSIIVRFVSSNKA